MDINNHPIKKIVKIEKNPTIAREIDRKCTQVSESLTVHSVQEIHDMNPRSIIAQLGVDTPAVFSTKTFVRSGERPTALGKTAEEVFSSSNFIRTLVSTYIQSDAIIPFDGDNGAGANISRVCQLSFNSSDNTIGPNAIRQQDVINRLNDYDAHDIIEGEDGWYAVSHYIYLPATNTDLNMREFDLQAFDPVMQATLRTAKELSFSKTYLTIILKDGTEFVLWYNKDFFGLTKRLDKGYPHGK